MPTKHKLGFGKGTITEYEDGTARYVGSLGPGSFRVRIADVTSFSVTSGDKPGERTLHLIGQGTTLASESVSSTATDKIEAWFRGHPDFGGNQQDAEEGP